MFESGCNEINYQIKYSKESYQNSSSLIQFECDNCIMQTQHFKPNFTKSFTEGQLIIEFINDDFMRIRTWTYIIRGYSEFLPRGAISLIQKHQHTPTQQEQIIDKLTRNITAFGLTFETLNFLKLTQFLEPMQEMMSHQKTIGLKPNDCLKNVLFHKWKKLNPQQNGEYFLYLKKKKIQSFFFLLFVCCFLCYQKNI